MHQPQREADVLADRIDGRQSALIAVVFLDLIDAAERAAGRLLRLGQWHPGGRILIGEEVEMGANLLLEALLPAAREQQVEDARHEDADAGHDGSSSRRFTIDTVLAQRAASFANCRRP